MMSPRIRIATVGRENEGEFRSYLGGRIYRTW